MRSTRARRVSVALACVLIAAGCGGTATPASSVTSSAVPSAPAGSPSSPAVTPAVSAIPIPTVSPTPYGPLTPTPAPTAAAGWRSFPLKGDLLAHSNTIERVIWFKGAWIAVGFAGGEGGGPAGAWWSTDGRRWTAARIDGPAPQCRLYGCDSVVMAAVTLFKDHLVAVGSRVWISRDGRTWDAVPITSSLKGGELLDVVSAGDRLVAVGTQAGSAAAWTSADGERWVRSSSTASFRDRVMSNVTVVGDELVAIGCRSHNVGGPIAAWASRDGRTWTSIAKPRLLGATPVEDASRSGIASDGPSSAWAVAVPGALVVATRGGWFVRCLGLDPGVAIPGGYVVAEGWLQSDEPDGGGVWATSDGSAWETLVPPVVAEVEALAASPDEVLVILLDRPRNGGVAIRRLDRPAPQPPVARDLPGPLCSQDGDGETDHSPVGEPVRGHAKASFVPLANAVTGKPPGSRAGRIVPSAPYPRLIPGGLAAPEWVRPRPKDEVSA